MSMTKRPKRQFSCEIINLDCMIPENHFLRVIEKYLEDDSIENVNLTESLFTLSYLMNENE